MKRYVSFAGLLLAVTISISQAQTSRSSDCREIASIRSATAQIISCSQAVSEAIKKALCMSGGGTVNREFGFAVIETPDGRYCTTPVTGFDPGVWRASVPLTAVAIFHTHRNAVSPRPSNQDILEADRIQIPFFVISSRALWIYEPDPDDRGKGRIYELRTEIAGRTDVGATVGK